jgi:ABC-type multidrug transport system fused ATPase/permease subunit
MLKHAHQALDLIEPQQRRTLAAVVAAMTVTAVLQGIGVVSIMPFIALVADPDLVQRSSWMAWTASRLGAATTPQFLTRLGVLIILLLAATNAFWAFSRWATVRFAWQTHDRLCHRMLASYLREPYTFYLSRNTADMVKRVHADVRGVVEHVLLPWMDVLAKSITTLLFVLLLIAVDPILALLSAGVLSGVYVLIYLVLRHRQRDLGYRRYFAFADMFRIASEVLGGIKDVKTMECEASYLSRFSDSSRIYAKLSTTHTMSMELPRFALETVAFGGIIATTIYLLQTRGSLGEALPVLALYALTGYRLFPGLQSIFASLAAIRVYAPALAALHEDLLRPTGANLARIEVGAEATSEARQPLLLAREIRFDRVTFRYAGAPSPALEDVELRIPVNAAVALVGGTGSGKTTVVDLLMGLFTPVEGRILIDDTVLHDGNIGAWRRGVGYVPQSIFLSDSTVAQNIAFGVRENLIDRAAVERAARAAHLDQFVEALPLGYDTIVGERGVRLSGGERQRLGIARALYRDPAVLVLDEATSALDGSTEHAVMEAIAALSGQKTVVLIAHRLATVKHCDLIYLLDGGRVQASGTFAELSADNIRFRAMAKHVSALP